MITKLWSILSYFAQPMRRKVISVLFFFLFSRKKDHSLASSECSMAWSVKRMSTESAQILCMTNVDTYPYKVALFVQPMRRKVISFLFFFLFSRKKDDSLASAERSMARSVKRMSAESAQILCMTNVDTYAYKAARGSLAPRRRTAELKRRAGYSCGGAHGVSNSCSNLEKSRLKKQEKASRPSACRL